MSEFDAGAARALCQATFDWLKQAAANTNAGPALRLITSPTAAEATELGVMASGSASATAAGAVLMAAGTFGLAEHYRQKYSGLGGGIGFPPELAGLAGLPRPDEIIGLLSSSTSADKPPAPDVTIREGEVRWAQNMPKAPHGPNSTKPPQFIPTKPRANEDFTPVASSDDKGKAAHASATSTETTQAKKRALKDFSEAAKEHLPEAEGDARRVPEIFREMFGIDLSSFTPDTLLGYQHRVKEWVAHLRATQTQAKPTECRNLNTVPQIADALSEASTQVGKGVARLERANTPEEVDAVVQEWQAEHLAISTAIEQVVPEEKAGIAAKRKSPEAMNRMQEELAAYNGTLAQGMKTAEARREEVNFIPAEVVDAPPAQQAEPEPAPVPVDLVQVKHNITLKIMELNFQRRIVAGETKMLLAQIRTESATKALQQLDITFKELLSSEDKNDPGLQMLAAQLRETAAALTEEGKARLDELALAKAARRQRAAAPAYSGHVPNGANDHLDDLRDWERKLRGTPDLQTIREAIKHAGNALIGTTFQSDRQLAKRVMLLAQEQFQRNSATHRGKFNPTLVIDNDIYVRLRGFDWPLLLKVAPHDVTQLSLALLNMPEDVQKAAQRISFGRELDALDSMVPGEAVWRRFQDRTGIPVPTLSDLVDVLERTLSRVR